MNVVKEAAATAYAYMSSPRCNNFIHFLSFLLQFATLQTFWNKKFYQHQNTKQAMEETREISLSLLERYNVCDIMTWSDAMAEIAIFCKCLSATRNIISIPVQFFFFMSIILHSGFIFLFFYFFCVLSQAVCK